MPACQLAYRFTRSGCILRECVSVYVAGPRSCCPKQSGAATSHPPTQVSGRDCSLAQFQMSRSLCSLSYPRNAPRLFCMNLIESLTIVVAVRLFMYVSIVLCTSLWCICSLNCVKGYCFINTRKWVGREVTLIQKFFIVIGFLHSLLYKSRLPLYFSQPHLVLYLLF